MALVPWPGGNIQTIFARVVLLAPYYTNPFLGGVPIAVLTKKTLPKSSTALEGNTIDTKSQRKRKFKNNKKENLVKTIED